MATRRKVVLIVLILLAALALVLILVIPRLADLDRYRPEVIARLQQETGRNIEIRRLSLRILPTLAVRADQVAIGNPPGFPAAPFLEIERVYAELDPLALLHREIEIRTLKLDAPTARLVSNTEGRWNTSSSEPPRATLRPAAWRIASAPSVVITKVQVEDGRLIVLNALESELGKGPSLEADGVSATLEDVDAEALGLHLMQAGSGWDGAPDGRNRGYSRMPRQIPWRPAVLTQAAAIQDAAAQEVARPEGRLAAHGILSARSARFGAIQVADIRSSSLEFYSGSVLLDGLALQLFGGRMTGSLVWDSAARPPRYTTHLSFTGIDVARALTAFPGARGKLTGTLEGHLDLTGWSALDTTSSSSGDPLDNKQGEGIVTVRNGTLPGIRLNPDLMALMKNIIHSGSGDPSSFRSMSADLEIAQGEIRSRQISIVGNGIGLEASGALALVGAGRLNYQGVASISARQNAVGNLVAGLLGSKMANGGQISFPFTLTGTLVAPHFDAPRSMIFH